MENLEAKEYYEQGVVLSSRGVYDEAVNYFDKGIKLDKMNTDLYLAKGVALANSNKFDEAKTEFETALKINKGLGAAYFHLGNLAIVNDDAAKGMENYNLAISNGFDEAQVYYCLGLLHEGNGEYDMAIRNYSKAVNKDPFRPDIRVRKAQIFVETGKYQEALQTLDELILANPDVFDGYHIKFEILTKLKQYDKANAVLAKAIELFPKDPAFALDKVSLMIEQGDSENALKVMEQLEKTDMYDENVGRSIAMRRSQIYAERNDAKSAISELEKALKVSEISGEFDEDVLFMLANLLLADGQYERVIETAKLLLDKAHDGYIKETARYFEPLALRMAGRMDEAVPKYNEAISEYRKKSLAAPGNLDLYIFRAMCLKDLEQYEKALEALDYIIALKPEIAEPYTLKASVLEAMGRKDEAAQVKAKANELLPPELRT